MATPAPVPSVAVEAKAASTSAPTKAHLAPTLHVKTDSLMVDFRNLHGSYDAVPLAIPFDSC